jgi:hypothetical protein
MTRPISLSEEDVRLLTLAEYGHTYRPPDALGGSRAPCAAGTRWLAYPRVPDLPWHIEPDVAWHRIALVR